MESPESWLPIPRTYDPLKAGSIDGTDVKPHDHGVVRALEATYKPSKYIKTDPKLTLFVGRLNPTTSEERLREFFAHYGEVRSCRLVRDIITGFSKCYAFVEYYELRDALAANDANQEYIDDYRIFVDFERERVLPGWVPRRLGGGFGGKKESGQLRFGGRDRPFKKPIVVNNRQGAPFPRSADFPSAPRGYSGGYGNRGRDPDRPDHSHGDRKDEFLRRKRMEYERSRGRQDEERSDGRQERRPQWQQREGDGQRRPAEDRYPYGRRDDYRKGGSTQR
ncbi:U11/U12 small nuclear ribonucleoprotein 35 kDa protein-like [Ixodes scapularis]